MYNFQNGNLGWLSALLEVGKPSVLATCRRSFRAWVSFWSKGNGIMAVFTNYTYGLGMERVGGLLLS